MTSYTDKSFWLDVRQALLMMVSAIERRFSIEPQTAELRKLAKQARRED